MAADAGWTIRSATDIRRFEELCRWYVELDPLVAARILSIPPAAAEDELLTFIDLTPVISGRGRGGQGEALTAALAIHRRCAVATDDRKATRMLNEHRIRLRTTLDLIKAWVDQEAIEQESFALSSSIFVGVERTNRRPVIH